MKINGNTIIRLIFKDVDYLQETMSCLKYTITTITFLLILQHVVAQSSDEAQVAQAIERLKIVMVKPDSKVLAELASNDLEYVHSSGTVRNKQGFIDEFMQGKTKLTKVDIQDQSIKISGDLAVVRHRMVADADIPGYPPIIDIIILMVWKKEAGQWKVLARQAAKLPGKK
jgi:ketosteroid isomerase-like protein